VVVHVGGASGRERAPELFVEHLKSRVRYFRKHRSPRDAAVAQALIAVSVLARWVARELQRAAGTIRGRTPSPRLESRRALFRAAALWVMGGQPLGPPERESTSS
jgi:hypothetical protein